MGNDLVKRLKACANGAYREPETLQKYCGEAAARIEELEEALKPFAEIEHSKYEPDDGPAFIEGVIQRLPTVGDLRRAARAYANKGEPT